MGKGLEFSFLCVVLVRRDIYYRFYVLLMDASERISYASWTLRKWTVSSSLASDVKCLSGWCFRTRILYAVLISVGVVSDAEGGIVVFEWWCHVVSRIP